ncbi:unnamed protein product, partial [Tenebrio molitor]
LSKKRSSSVFYYYSIFFNNFVVELILPETFQDFSWHSLNKVKMSVCEIMFIRRLVLINRS